MPVKVNASIQSQNASLQGCHISQVYTQGPQKVYYNQNHYRYVGNYYCKSLSHVKDNYDGHGIVQWLEAINQVLDVCPS